MPRSAKKSEGKIHKSDSPSNEISAEKLKGFVAEYEAESEAMGEIALKAAQDCQPHKDHQKEIIKSAAEAGVPKKVFKAKMKERSLRRKADACDHALSDELKEAYADIGLKLGDLGAWAKDNAEKQEAA